MRTHALQTNALLEVPRLRLVPRKEDTPPRSRSARRADRAPGARQNARADENLRAIRPQAKGTDKSPVLVAGGERNSRAAVLRDLTQTMPANTRFDQASDAWEVLALAPESRMVVLSGDLGDLSAKSAMHMLAHRLPEVPVVSLAACA